MTDERRLERFRQMARMRAFEEATLDGLRRKDIHGELHTAFGQEAVGAGIAESLRPEDAFVSTHRNHCHALAKGVPAYPLLAEIFERETGLCRGRGGHMHPFHAETNFSATGIVGASLPVALGYAYGFSIENRPAIAVGASGDGGSHTGGFHETLVMAAAMKLPLVVLVENNALAISVSFADVSPTETIAERAAGYGVEGIVVDGTDVDAVADGFARAAKTAREGGGPVVIEAMCHRFRGHFEGDPDSYREREEKKRIQKMYDPLVLHREKLTADGIGAGELDKISDAEKASMAEILQRVRDDAPPDPASALSYRFVAEAS